VSILIGLLSLIYILACIFLIFVVLIQKGEGGGLGGAFGGGAVETAFGSSADMTWKRATSVAAGLFLILSLVLGLLETPPKSQIQEQLGKNEKTAGASNPGGSTPGGSLTPGGSTPGSSLTPSNGDSKPADSKPADSKPADSKPAGAADGQPAGTGQ
jgi:preprotein translocase subunit SecG